MQARNIYGFSADSNTVTILAAQKPDVPVAPTTSFNAGTVTISWTEPSPQGSPIILYSVTILKLDGGYAASAFCDGSL